MTCRVDESETSFLCLPCYAISSNVDKKQQERHFSTEEMRDKLDERGYELNTKAKNYEVEEIYHEYIMEQALENARDGTKTVTFPLLGDIVAIKKTKKQNIKMASSHEYLAVIEKRSFGRHFRALEKRNYIAMCEPCKYPSQCKLCRTLEDVRNTHKGSNIIQGLNDGDV